MVERVSFFTPVFGYNALLFNPNGAGGSGGPKFLDLFSYLNHYKLSKIPKVFLRDLEGVGTSCPHSQATFKIPELLGLKSSGVIHISPF